MKNFCKKLEAFTLAEIAISLMVLAVIASATIVAIKPRSTFYTNKFMYYSAFNNLQQGVYDLLAQGALPTIGNDTVNNPPTGLCNRLSDLFNTIPLSATSTVNCDIPVIGDAGPFTVDNANFITANGIRFFNFGQDAAGTPTAFTVYADIDGPRRNAVLNEDIFRFNIYTTNGLILPVPAADSPGANNTDYLSVSVNYLDTSTGHYVTLLNGGTYRQAVCVANKAQSLDETYCTDLPAQFQANVNCPSANACQIIINQPRVSFIN